MFLSTNRGLLNITRNKSRVCISFSLQSSLSSHIVLPTLAQPYSLGMEEVQSSQKPREERPYQEIIPELDVSKPLRIVRDTQASSESRDAGSLQTSSSLLSSISNILCGVVGQLNRIQSRDSTAQEEGLDGLKQRHEKTVGPDQLLSHLVPVNDGPVLFPKSSTDKIPKGSFRTLQSDNHDKEGSFKLPERHFIRYLEPSEEELLERREYDMDELGK